jgi:predicted hydrolase (HD superfamily)
MLTVADAQHLVDLHLRDTPRAAHSRFVAHIMRRLAVLLGGDADLWEIVGLCHDLDFLVTSGDWNRHGLLTVEWLGDSIPADARAAIASHDHRTGVRSDMLLADILKLADALAVIDQRAGRSVLADLDHRDPYPALRKRLGDRPHLADILERCAGRHKLLFAGIVKVMGEVPPLDPSG